MIMTTIMKDRKSKPTATAILSSNFECDVDDFLSTYYKAYPVSIARKSADDNVSYMSDYTMSSKYTFTLQRGNCKCSIPLVA